MKKSLLLASLLLATILSSAFSVKEWQNTIYHQIKAETVKALQDNFKREIKVGKVEGRIVGQVVFHDVSMPGFVDAQKVYVDFSLLKLAYKRDVVPAITKITIVDGDFKITRDRSGRLNVLHILPEAEPGGPPPPEFRAKLVFENCRADYEDARGFREDFTFLREKMRELKGYVDLSKKDRIKIDVSGNIDQKTSPAVARVRGDVNLKKNKFKYTFSATRADLEKWGNYAVPFDPLKFEGGKANLSITLSDPKIKGWPLSINGNFTFFDGSARLGDYRLTKTSGQLILNDQGITVKNGRGEMNGLKLSADGNFRDFSRQNLNFNVSFSREEIKNLTAIFPQTRDLALEGLASARASIQGTARNPTAWGNITVHRGKFYTQEFSGLSNITFADKLLKIDIPGIVLKKGALSGSANLNFSKEMPNILAKIRLKNVGLAEAIPEVPGIQGNVTGELNLSGPLNKMRGDLSAKLSQAELVGQPIEETSARFIIQEGEVLLENFSASSKTAFLRALGSIGRDLTFDFKAQAEGIKLSGKGIVGSMEARIDAFDGDLRFKLDEAFLTAPLKNLSASGNVRLSRGMIGEQRFDSATGTVNLGNGLLRVDDVTIKNNKSVLQAVGQTGIGYPTHLSISGKKINLDDLKILNVILPQEARDPTGQADINIVIQGEIPPDTIIASLDPILNLDATGEAVLASAEVAEIDVLRCALNFKWEDRNLSFPSCVLKTEKSDLEFNLMYSKNNRIKGSLEGIIDLYEFRKFTSKYGRLEGKLGLNLVADGPAANPALAASFWINDFKLNRLDFESIEGSLAYSQGILNLSRPARFSNGGNEFEISGMADLRALPATPEAAYLELDLNIVRSDLFSALSLIEKINNEYARRFYVPSDAEKNALDLAGPALPDARRFTRNGRLSLYRQNGEADYFLKGWERIYEETRKEIVLPIEANLGGELKGRISLRGYAGALSGTFDGEVKDGFFRNFTFDKLKGEASLRAGRVEIKKLELSKFPGNISAKGELGLDGQANLELTAVKMPLEILKIMFDQEFKGTFNMRSTLTGSIDDPLISASLVGNKVSLSGIYFDQARISFTKNNGDLLFHEFTLKEDGNTSTLSGSINLHPPGNINLDADLKNGALGLFNLISKDVKWIEGNASANLKIRGTTEKPVFNGSAEAEDAKIYIRAIDSEIKNIKGSAEVENNLVTIPALSGDWQGLRTKGYPNFIGLAGTVDIGRLLSEQMVSLNLSLSPGYFYVDIPNFYTGGLRVKDVHLYGPLRFDLSEGPTLKAGAALENAVINLTKNGGSNGRKKVFPLTYDLNVSLNQNVYAVMGDVATFDLSNIFMNLEIRSDELKITGTSAEPSLLGKISVRRGTVTIFNREFTLLSAIQQESYYLLDPDKIKDNEAVFTGEKGREGIMPNVNITAKVDVEETEKDESGELRKKKVIILSRLRGVIGSTEKDRGLTIFFNSFEEDQNKKAIPANYNEQQIKVMLLPDFIKSLTGVEGGEDVDTNAVVADYIGSRFQTLVFRGIERDLEQRFGLESLTLEYNFGKDIRQAMGVTEQRILEEKPDWRVGFVKGLFDNFYVDVKYSQANLDTGGVESYLNYQLTYKLTPIWSIIYYREEPTGAENLLLGDSKITLKAGFSFW